MKNLTWLKYISLICLSILIISACADKYSKTDLIGKWKVSKWQVESSGKNISSKMDMDFMSDGQYAIDYGAKNEAGKYWISGDYLHTVAEGKSEMSVRFSF